MEKVYVHVKNGFPINEDIQKAIDGFEYLGYETIPMTMENMLAGDLDNLAKIYPVVGSIDFMTMLFKRFGRLPEPIDYPDDIIYGGLMNRFIIKTTIENILYDIDNSDGDNISIFVKPVKTKLFDGILITDKSHTSYLREFDKNTLIWASAPINIVSEHRIYVHNRKAIYGCNYSGDFKLTPDYSYVDKLIEAYDLSPKAYTIDIAILADGCYDTVVEFNDFWAIGGYGIAPWDYANMLKDRYFEIIK